MKIRNLLIKVKQKQIIANNPYILIFHCSGLTNLQWRQLKLLLHNTFALRAATQEQTSQKAVIHTNEHVLTNDEARNVGCGAVQSTICSEAYYPVKSNTFFQAVRNSNNMRSATNQLLWRLRRPVRLQPHTKRSVGSVLRCSAAYFASRTALAALISNEQKKLHTSSQGTKVVQSAHAKSITTTTARTQQKRKELVRKRETLLRRRFVSASHNSLQPSESFNPNTYHLTSSDASRKHIAKNKTSAINLVSTMRGRKDYFNLVNSSMQKSFKALRAAKLHIKPLQPDGKKTYKVLTPIQKHAKIQSGPFCLLYSTHNKLPEGLQSGNKNVFPWSNLVTTIQNSFEYKTNLVLLYGHINSAVRCSAAIRLYNHIDVQDSISLDKKNVLTNFLQSINYHTHSFNQCLNTIQKTEL